MQARRRAQPSGTNSPSSSHPRLKHRARCVIFDPCPPCGRQGRPGEGFLAGSNTSEPRGSAPRERDHRGGDHPVPSRTRQLSPPSPRVLQREAAGGQGVALAEGAFLYAPREARGGTAPCGPLRVLGAIWLYDAGGAVPPEHPARTFLVSAALPGGALRTSHAPKSHRGESSLWDFLRFEVEKRLLDVWLFSVRVLWSHAGSRFRLLPNCV